MESNQGENKPPVISPKVAYGRVGSAASAGAGPSLCTSDEFLPKETNAGLGGESLKKDKTCSKSNYDLVEQMQYLYVRVVKARDIALSGEIDLFAEVKLGNYIGITKKATVTTAEWDQIFAVSKDCIQSTTVEILVKIINKKCFTGRVWFDLSKVPHRVPPDSELEPRWYRMEDKKGNKDKTGELMVSIWFGSQADEAFAEAFHFNAAHVHPDVLSSLNSKVYLSPTLRYLRVSIIEAQDIMPGHKGPEVVRFPEFSVKVKVGDHCLSTKNAAPSATRSFSNPYWNEELFFVVAEPFEDDLSVWVEDGIDSDRVEVVGRVPDPVATEKQADEKQPVTSKWFDLDTHFGKAGNNNNLVTRFVSRIHMRVSFEGVYHVHDEDTMYNSDVRPTDNRRWKPPIGELEMGILNAEGLKPVMKMKDGKQGAPDAYCVAEYGEKWVRTRTVVDSFSPTWNEQFVWEVYDPCTVVTVGVFHNRSIYENTNSNAEGPDCNIGKIRLRLSTLETDRVYTYSYPLLVLLPSGVKKMGELHLAVRFSCSSVTNMLLKYATPLLPKMHYLHSLSQDQLDRLRYQAMNAVASRLSSVEPPLCRMVVEYMLGHDSPMRRWSLRRSKANFFRAMRVLSSLIAIIKWLEVIRNWQKPVHSALFLIIFVTVVMLPKFIFPAILFYLVFACLWNYRYRPRHPLHLDTGFSMADPGMASVDDLDEEFDPTTHNDDILRFRYDRLRSIAGRIQTVMGDFATLAERLQAFVSWRDPRATFLFVVFCLVAAVCFCVVPIRVVVALLGLYSLRPPMFRNKLPSPAFNFFRRLPSEDDSTLYETRSLEREDAEREYMTQLLNSLRPSVRLAW